MVRRDVKETKDHLAPKDHKVARGIPVPRETKETRADPVTRETEVPLDQLVNLDLRGPLDQLDPQECRENQDFPVLRVRLDLLEEAVRLGYLDNRGCLVEMELPEPLVETGV